MKYFTIRELEHSPYADEHKITNKIPFDKVGTWQRFIDEILNKIREKYGNPIYSTSGYRSPFLNQKVGGVPNSHHTGISNYCASDLGSGKGKAENRKLFDLIVSMIKSKEIDIAEIGLEYNGAWVHLSWNLDPKLNVNEIWYQGRKKESLKMK